MTQVVDPSDAGYLLYSVLPLSRIFELSRLHGRLTYAVARRERGVVRRNLADALAGASSKGELELLTRRFFEYKRIRGMMQAVAPRLTRAEMARLFPVEGLEHLDRALEQGRGAVLLGSHLNSISLFLSAIDLRERGYDVRVAIPTANDPWPATAFGTILNRLFKTPRLAEAMGAFYVQFNIRPIVRSLRANAVVAQTGDGLHSARFVEVDFLGRRLPFPTGMVSIAQMTGALVVPAFQVGTPPHGLRVVFEEPWSVQREQEAPGALHAAVAAYAKRLEHHVLENIACWEHWLIEDTLATIAAWPQKSLEERYEL